MSAPDTAALVKEYQENGFAVAERLFDPSEVAELNTAITQILDVPDIGSVAEVEPGDNGMARRIWSPTKQHSAFERAAAHPGLLDHVEALIGPDILFHYSKLHLKAPQVGSVVDWHQDFSYYPHTNTDLVTALVYLDDTTTENSALQVIPGSHRRGLADHYVDGYFRGKVAGAGAPTRRSPCPSRRPQAAWSSSTACSCTTPPRTTPTGTAAPSCRPTGQPTPTRSTSDRTPATTSPECGCCAAACRTRHAWKPGHGVSRSRSALRLALPAPGGRRRDRDCGDPRVRHPGGGEVTAP